MQALLAQNWEIRFSKQALSHEEFGPDILPLLYQLNIGYYIHGEAIGIASFNPDTHELHTCHINLVVHGSSWDTPWYATKGSPNMHTIPIAAYHVAMDSLDVVFNKAVDDYRAKTRPIIDQLLQIEKDANEKIGLSFTTLNGKYRDVFAVGHKTIVVTYISFNEYKFDDNGSIINDDELVIDTFSMEIEED